MTRGGQWFSIALAPIVLATLVLGSAEARAQCDEWTEVQVIITSGDEARRDPNTQIISGGDIESYRLELICEDPFTGVMGRARVQGEGTTDSIYARGAIRVSMFSVPEDPCVESRIPACELQVRTESGETLSVSDYTLGSSEDLDSFEAEPLPEGPVLARLICSCFPGGPQ